MTLVGKKALVLGGTKGIGLGFARRCASLGAEVTVVGRSDGSHVVDQLKELNAANHGSMQADLSSISETSRVVRDYLTQNQHQLDVLILSQGIATFQGRTETSEGIDVKLSLHYYSRVTAALEARDALNQTGGVALFVLSGGVHSAFVAPENDWDLKNHYSLKAAADAAGFYTDVAIQSLAGESPNVRWVHAAPGFVDSNWGDSFAWPLAWLVKGLKAIGATSIDKCAEKLSPALLAPQRGWFICDQNSNIVAPLPEQTDDVRDAIWKHTLDLIHQHDRAD